MKIFLEIYKNLHKKSGEIEVSSLIKEIVQIINYKEYICE